MANSLAAALAAKDNLAIAMALRADGAVVPILEADGHSTVRVFRVGDADKYMLLLFSSPEAFAAMVPEEDDPKSRVYTADELLDFIRANLGVLDIVWIDIAGPDATQAAPSDIIAALELA
jgi:hypothetical protein